MCASTGKIMHQFIPKQLVGLLASNEPLALAFSGGVDSRFLAYVCKLCQIDVILLHCTGYNYPAAETIYARNWAATNSLRLEEIVLDPFRLKAIRLNKRDRCYHCKREVFKQIKKRLKSIGQEGRTICDGTNYDDLKVYRPGQKAINELGILTPLAQALLGKDDIRRLGAKIGLSHPEQKASPCLLTRLAYDLLGQKEDLAKIDRCESELKELLVSANLQDLPDLRLRLTPEPLLQLTNLPEDLRPKMREIVSKYGFNDCQLLVEENISGFFDRTQENPETLPLL